MSDKYLKTRLTCYSGYVVQAVINNFLPILFVVLQDEYALSYEKLGRIILVNFSMQLVADICTPALVKRLGYRMSAVLCQLLSFIGFWMLAILPSLLDDAYTGILCSVLVYAFGSGLMEVLLSPIIECLPSKSRSSSMAILHSFYSWGQALAVVATTALVFLLGGENWRFIPLLWSVLPAVNAVSFLRVAMPSPKTEGKGERIKKMVLSREFICLAVFMFCAGASEIAMAEWASVFTQRGLGVNKVLGDLLGPCAFALFMGAGRVIFAAFSGKLQIKKLLFVNNLLCATCYLTAALSRHPVPVLIACALCGFAISLAWPSTYSMASERFPLGSAVMFSILAVCGDLGCAVGPWILGLIADRFSLRAGMLVCAAFPVIMIVSSIVQGDTNKKTVAKTDDI